MSSRKKRPSGPQTAAGLVRFFEDVQSKITISPMLILIAASVFTITIIAVNLIVK